MNKIVKIDSSACDDVRQQIETHLLPILKELGFTSTIGRMGYDNSSIGFKMELTLEGEKSRQEKKDLADLNWAKTIYKDDIDFTKIVTHGSKRYEIVGWSFISRKYPIILKDHNRKDGMLTKMTLEQGKLLFQHQFPKSVSERKEFSKALDIIKNGAVNE